MEKAVKHHAFGAGEPRRLTIVRFLDERRPPRPFPTFYQAQSRRRSLADDADFLGHPLSPRDDPDMEIGAWPEMINQARLGEFARLADWHEDDEDDDPDTGIDDECHDALQEDGI
jgi:hypothetical protein